MKKTLTTALFALLLLGACSTGPDKAEARTYCERDAKTQFKNPSTVDFPYMEQEIITTGDRVKIEGPVTATNDLGGTVTYRYVCIATDTGNDWEVDTQVID